MQTPRLAIGTARVFRGMASHPRFVSSVQSTMRRVRQAGNRSAPRGWERPERTQWHGPEKPSSTLQVVPLTNHQHEKEDPMTDPTTPAPDPNTPETPDPNRNPITPVPDTGPARPDRENGDDETPEREETPERS